MLGCLLGVFFWGKGFQKNTSFESPGGKSQLFMVAGLVDFCTWSKDLCLRWKIFQNPKLGRETCANIETATAKCKKTKRPIFFFFFFPGAFSLDLSDPFFFGYEDRTFEERDAMNQATFLGFSPVMGGVALLGEMLEVVSKCVGVFFFKFFLLFFFFGVVFGR